ncbi:MAG: histidine kinase [Balneolaceae bacterium]|nr:histidine kinase [Balneolaceae bacterium]
MTFNYLADLLFSGFFFIAIYTRLEIFGFFVVYVGISSLIDFSKSWFREMELEKTMQSLQKEKVETELKALRAQINPHFLFNSLNHIYALAYRQSPETAPAILQLSELLRYTLKQMDKATVPLQDELNYLQKYVDLYKHRLQHPEKVRFEIKGPVKGLMIAPLLLIAFVENCFKHGSIEEPGEMIDIEIQTNTNRLFLKTQNSTGIKTALPETSGIGLDNVRRRLNLLYPGKHILEIEDEEGTFIAKLTLDLI